MKYDTRNKYPWLLWLIITAAIAVQLILFYYKDLMHIDEIFSYGTANGEFGKKFFYRGKEGADNFLLTKDDFISYLVPLKSSYKSLYSHLSYSVHMPLYFILLHTTSLFFVPNFSLISGVIINVFVLFFMILGMYKILTLIFKDEWISLCGLILFAFFEPVLSMEVYIRMYLLWMMFSIWYIYYMVRILNNKYNHKDLLMASLFCFLQMYTHFYGLIFGFVATTTACAILLFQKQYKKMLNLGIYMLLAVALIYALFPQIIEIGTQSDRGIEFTNRLKDIAEETQRILQNTMYIIIDTIQGQYILFGIIFVGLITGYAICFYKRKICKQDQTIILFIIWLFLGYGILCALIQPQMVGVQVRYFTPIVPLSIILIITVLFIWGKIFNLSTYKIACIILTIAAINGIYTATYQENPYYMRADQQQAKFINLIKNKEVWWGLVLGRNQASLEILFGIDKLLNAEKVWFLADGYHPNFIEFATREKEKKKYAYLLLPKSQEQYLEGAIDWVKETTGRKAYYLFTMRNDIYTTTFSGSVFLVAPY